MNSASLRLRRATLDDLPALRRLWTNAQWPANELEARLTEFQVVESNGIFAGAIGLQICRQHARFYAEDFADFSVADAARTLFWERIQKLAANHGVFRVWTQETSPFWKNWGFQPAVGETLERLPDEWKNSAGRWLTLELKSEDAIAAALENQFAGFREAEKQRTAKVIARAQTLKTLITAASLVIFFICLAVAAYLLLHRPLTAR